MLLNHGFHLTLAAKPATTQRKLRISNTAWCSASAASADTVVDIGSPASTAGEVDPLVHRLHERCIAKEQPFHWNVATAGLDMDERSTELQRAAVAAAGTAAGGKENTNTDTSLSKAQSPDDGCPARFIDSVTPRGPGDGLPPSQPAPSTSPATPPPPHPSGPATAPTHAPPKQPPSTSAHPRPSTIGPQTVRGSISGTTSGPYVKDPFIRTGPATFSGGGGMPSARLDCPGVSNPTAAAATSTGGGDSRGDDQPDVPAPSDVSVAPERCAQLHPGSVCCTSTTVDKDLSSHSCVVTLRTSVKLTEPHLHVTPPELEELAWLGVRDAARDAIAALNRGRSGTRGLPAGRAERHAYVCGMLQNGTIREAKRMENGFGHVSYQLVLEDKATGARIRAAFKPRVEGDCDGWHRVPIEVAAYRLGLMLGMDLVPPAVLRSEADVDWTHYPAGGAFIYWCNNARQLNSAPLSEWSMPAAVLLSDTRILDVLIQNSDRHAGHFLVAEHWADGAYTNSQNNNKHKGSGSNTGIGDGGGNAHWRGRTSPVLIDHAAGFRHDAFVCLDHENAFLTGPTRRISSRTYLRLRFLDGPSLQAALGSLITPQEVAMLLERRDAILAFFDKLVAEHGYHNVVLEV